jgi:DNA-binding response OmpR family regulator
VPLSDVLTAVWGTTEGQGTSELVRAHVRNLRVKLREIGLVDIVRSRRGRGYALEL